MPEQQALCPQHFHQRTIAQRITGYNKPTLSRRHVTQARDDTPVTAAMASLTETETETETERREAEAEAEATY